jgi:hypothetical protein
LYAEQTPQQQQEKHQHQHQQQPQPQPKQDPSQTNSLHINRDSDPSSSFPLPAYFTIMPQSTGDEKQSHHTAFVQQYEDQNMNGHLHSMQYSSSPLPPSHHLHHHDGHMPPQISQDVFDSPQDMNRRTLTQEQFDAFANVDDSMNTAQFNYTPQPFPEDADVLHQIFPDMHECDFKQQNVYAFSSPLDAPLSSNDSTLPPSTTSEQSMFPLSAAMQEHTAMPSAASSDWTDSRSSSVSANPSQGSPFQSGSGTPHHPHTSAQWQPGQSVPVDPNDLQQQFQDARRHSHHHAQEYAHVEQPLAWPADEAYLRRDSQAGAMLEQQLGQIAIQTPQPPQSSTFRSPPPVQGNGINIAARRQRPRPAQLGVASLRSQSHTGAAQPASPNQLPNLAPAQQLRRIRSTNYIHSVAQGRVQKSNPNSAQRSPMSFSFADAMASASGNRHALAGSNGNLAPPPPLSPSEASHCLSAFPHWQSSFSRPASINENDVDLGSNRKFSSPPHTPLYHHHHQQHSMLQRVGNNVITENTPPQSAPAIQTTFPANAFLARPTPPMSASLQPPGFASQLMNSRRPDHRFHHASASFGQPFMVSQSESDAKPHASLAFAESSMDSQGHFGLAYPPSREQIPFHQHAATPQSQQLYEFHPSTDGTQVSSPFSKSDPTEFVVHEYTPPSDVKHTVTSRKAAAETGPKNYTFTNHGPEHFEKGKKGEAKCVNATSSPASVFSTS